MNQEEFIELAFKKLQKKQDGFTSKFDLNAYDSWNYEQAIGLFTFSNDDNKKELNFLFKSVGTFSHKSKTWLWSWANEHTLNQVKLNKEVANFGKENKYWKLTKKQWDAEEYDGWEMIAATDHILKSLGGYRIPGDEEEPTMFLIFTDLISKEEAKELKETVVQCEIHGSGRGAYVCQHLNKENKKGFNEAFPTEKGMEIDEDEDLQAWCDSCEKEWQKAGEWNDENMKIANIKVICEACYFEMKKANS